MTYDVMTYDVMTYGVMTYDVIIYDVMKYDVMTRGTKVVDSASLTCRKYFQKLGLTENIWENIMV